MSQTLIPYLVAKGADEAIRFYIDALGAVEDFRMTDPGDGRIGHAELILGSSRMMVSDEYPDFGAVSPDTLGGTAVTLHLASKDVDADVERAAAAGAIVLRAPADQFFGERTATLLDPFGHRWMLSQTIETVTSAEMQKRWEEDTSA